jgi:hypothetical protein
MKTKYHLLALNCKVLFNPIYSIFALFAIVMLSSCDPEDYLPNKIDNANTAQLRIFNFSGEFGKNQNKNFDEYSYFYVNSKLNNTFETAEIPFRITPPSPFFASNEAYLQLGKFVLPSVTNKGEGFNNTANQDGNVYVDLADNPPYTYINSKRAKCFPGFYYSNSKGPVVGSNDFSRWANIAAGAVKLKVTPLELTDITDPVSGEPYQIPSDDFTETTVNLSSNKTYTGIWGIQKRSSEELKAKQEKPERKLVLIEEPTGEKFSSDASYIRFVNMTEQNLTEEYLTPNPNSQFPDLSTYNLYKATTAHPVQAVDIYIRETYLDESSPWYIDGFKPTLAVANLKPFDASNNKFTAVLSLKNIMAKDKGIKLPRVEVFMYPAGTSPDVGVAPVVYIKNLKLLVKGKKLSTTIATYVFAIEKKVYDWDEQYGYRGFIYNFIPKDAYNEFYE